MKQILLGLLFTCFSVFHLNAQNAAAIIHYDFSQTSDISKTYTGELHNGAQLTSIGNYPILDLGTHNGYFQFDSNIADIMSTLTDYTITTNVYIPESSSITSNGNFIWCFANSASSGYLFMSAKDSRFAITENNYRGEQTVGLYSKIMQGQWFNITYTQSKNTGCLYINGKKVSEKEITLTPADLNRCITNYLGKSCYNGDAYLKGAQYNDFRIYNYALKEEEIIKNNTTVFALNNGGKTISDMSDEEIIAYDWQHLNLKGNLNNLYEDIDLPLQGSLGSKITWQSHDNNILSNTGKIVKGLQQEKQHTILTCTLTYGSKRITKDINVNIHENEPYTHYLFVYFPANNNENIYYALSQDGYQYTPMNNGNKIIDASKVSIKKGLRDPHILRGEDGTFYMAITDMKSSEGWSSNRGIVLMRSTDLIHWTHATIHFPTRYAGTHYANVTRVWAPETIWDPNYINTDGSKGRYMVYFSLLTNDNTISYDKVFYCYANDDFTDFIGEPIYLFDRGSATIDMDIVYNESDSLYHGFFKNEGSGGICQVTASTLTAPIGKEGTQWSKPSGTLQQTNVAVEGAGVFKLTNKDAWILMYDCYNNGYYQFCSSNDLNKFTFVQNTLTSGSFTPRHGTVLPITNQEASALISQYPTAGYTAITNQTINKQVVHTAYTTIDGKPLYKRPTTKGIYIGIQHMSDGTVQSIKIINK